MKMRGPHQCNGDKWQLNEYFTMENINYFVMRRCQWDIEDPKKEKKWKEGSLRHMIEQLGCIVTNFNKLNPTMASQSHSPCALLSPISFISFQPQPTQSTTINPFLTPQFHSPIVNYYLYPLMIRFYSPLIAFPLFQKV